MTTSDFVVKVLLKATGKIVTVSAGDTKWNKVLGIANYYIDTWQDELDIDWDSLYEPAYVVGTVTATDTYDLDNEIRKISETRGDKVRVYHSDGENYTEYELVPAAQLKRYSGRYCAKIGRTLRFTEPFASTDAEFGGEIKVPVYVYGAHLESARDSVPVDIPNWLVAITAAEYVRNDTTRQNQYPNLIAEANQLMERMKADVNAAQADYVDTPWAPMGANWD